MKTSDKTSADKELYAKAVKSFYDMIKYKDTNKIKLLHSKFPELINQKTELNSGGDTTPLMYAVSVTDADENTLDTLASLGADFTQRKKDGSTVLISAIKVGENTSLILDLYELYCTKGSPSVVKAQMKNYIDMKDNSGRTALHWAAVTDQQKVVNILIEQGADVNAKDNEGKTPLHLYMGLGFSKERALPVVESFIKHGADAKSTDKKGFSPIQNLPSMDKVRLEKLTAQKVR
jgi:ankyrin repeat protein